jgi:hypothetical protein
MHLIILSTNCSNMGKETVQNFGTTKREMYYEHYATILQNDVRMKL